jgi:hypothetical protein
MYRQGITSSSLAKRSTGAMPAQPGRPLGPAEQLPIANTYASHGEGNYAGRKPFAGGRWIRRPDLIGIVGCLQAS